MTEHFRTIQTVVHVCCAGLKDALNQLLKPMENKAQNPHAHRYDKRGRQLR